MSIKVTEGHDEVTGLATVGSLSIRQFQASISIPDTAAFQLNRRRGTPHAANFFDWHSSR